MPFFMASTPARTGVDWAFRLRAAAGPAVGAGRPEVTWLKRVGLAREGRVDQPSFTDWGVEVWNCVVRRREAGEVVRRGSRRVSPAPAGASRGAIFVAV